MSKAGNPKVWLSLMAFVGIVAALDYLLLDYLVSHGLEPKLYPVQVASLQFPIPLLGLTFVGLLIVAIVAWLNMSSISISVAREMSQLENLRILRAAGVALFLFSAVLFGPYIIGASVFWRQMALVGRGIPQLAGFLQSLFYSIQPVAVLDSLTKLAISQNVAAAALVAASGLIGHYQRRIRRMR